jgi:hypothetical protein
MTGTLNVLGTIVAIVANVSVLIGFPIYVFYARRDGYAARHRAPELASTSQRIRVIETPELHAARALTEQLAQAIEERARLWDFAPEMVELPRYDQSAGSPAYLDLTPGALAAQRRSDGFDRDRMISTGEMYALWGAPVEVDEWAAPEPVGAR